MKTSPLTLSKDNVILKQLQIKQKMMKQLIQDIKELTNFFQFLQDFNPQDYLIETGTEFDMIDATEVNSSTIL